MISFIIVFSKITHTHTHTLCVIDVNTIITKCNILISIENCSVCRDNVEYPVMKKREEMKQKKKLKKELLLLLLLLTRRALMLPLLKKIVVMM